MSLFVKIFLASLSFLTVYVGIKINNILQIPPVPQLEDTFWGPGNPIKEDTTIKPFKINVSDQVLNDLNQRLKNAKPFAPPLEGVQQQYGINTKLLSQIVEFWKTKYNWREREQFLNKYPQFKTNIQGLNIHFIHVKPKATNGERVLPLLLLHGWPGSVREFYNLIPLLTTPQKGTDFVFEVIVPSLPGYGFSDGASKPGLGPAQMAVVFKNLMKCLGFEKFYIQGGDWGAFIVMNLATLFPENVLGVHSNMCYIDSPIVILKLLIGSFYPPLVVEKEFENRLYPLSDFISNILLEFGYMHIQATKPDTVGVALNDSPVGLAGYILEKFTTWTNPTWRDREDGGLTEKFTYTDLLDNVMIYWVTNSITTSARIYSEYFNKDQLSLHLPSIPTNVPSACPKFKYELAYLPDHMITHKFPNLMHSPDIPEGGHFAAFEVPELLASDIWTAVKKFENYHESK